MTEPLSVTILGSGTSTGVPVIGCECEVCRSDSPKNNRTRCSALLTYGGKNVLIDTSTDLRSQALRENIRHVDAVLYTHHHADHLHGIDELRVFNLQKGDPIPVYGEERTLGAIRQFFGYIFEDLGEGFRPRLETRRVEGPLELFGLEVLPVELLHGKEPALGYRVGDFAYLTDCSAVPEASRQRLGNLEVLVIDGLRFRAHQTHFNIAQAIEVGRSLGARRTVLTHLSHDVDYHRHSQGLPAGVEFAYDGQRFDFVVGH